MNPQSTAFGMVINQLVRSQEERWAHLIELAEQGDCSSSTVVGQASPRARPGLRHAVTINYRKESGK